MKYRINITEIDENGGKTVHVSEGYEGFLLLGKCDDGRMNASCMHLTLRTLSDMLKSYDPTRQAALIVTADIELERLLDKLAKSTEGDESNGTDEACDPERQ